MVKGKKVRYSRKIGTGCHKQTSFLQTIIDTIPQPIFFKTAKGEYLGCNKAFEAYHNTAREQIIGKTVYEIIGGTSAELFHRQDIEMIANNETAINENIIITDDRVFMLSKKAFVNAKGQPRGIVGIINDITEFKKNQQELQKSQERFKALVNSMQDMVFTLDVTGACSGFYGHWALKSDLSTMMVKGKTLEKLLDSNYIEFVQHIMPQVLEGKDILYDCTLSLPIGIRDIQLSLSPLYDEYREINGIVGVGRDITLRKMAVEALRESENMHRSLVEATPYGIIMADRVGQIHMANQQSASLHGFNESEEMLGHNLFTLVLPEDRSLIEKQFSKVILSGQPQVLECVLVTKEGSSFTSEIMTSVVLDAQGHPIFFINVERDITDRKNMEEILKRQNEELQSMLSQLKGAQIKLIQQEKLAGIGQLAAGVAHEINNPLGFVTSNFKSLKTYVERMQSIILEYQELKRIVTTVDDAMVQESITKITTMEREKKLAFLMEDIKELFEESNDGLDRVGKIVIGLRTFARVDQDLNFQEYDLNAGIKNTLLVARNEIKYWANVEENFAQIPLIEVVGGYINQVLLNIIVNSAHAIKEKKEDSLGLIKITTYNDDNHVYCEIADDGIGIPEENRQKILEPFFTTKAIGKGTGLGLSISYDIIVHKHSGELTFHSQVGSGTVFIIKLPIKQNTQSS